jgi:hypothetical protein
MTLGIANWYWTLITSTKITWESDVKHWDIIKVKIFSPRHVQFWQIYDCFLHCTCCSILRKFPKLQIGTNYHFVALFPWFNWTNKFIGQHFLASGLNTIAQFQGAKQSICYMSKCSYLFPNNALKLTPDVLEVVIFRFTKQYHWANSILWRYQDQLLMCQCHDDWKVPKFRITGCALIQVPVIDIFSIVLWWINVVFWIWTGLWAWCKAVNKT